MNDPLNIASLKSQDQREFNKLVLHLEHKVFNLAAHLLNNKSDAEDATQEVFIIVYQSLPQFKGNSKISTWIYRIAVNKCKEIIRYKTRNKRFGILIGLNDRTSLTISSKDQTPEEKLFSDERTNELLSAIESLSETQKIAYTMYNMEDFSYKEIAEIMQLSLSSVESLIFRAKKNLKSKLEIYFKNNEL